MRRIQWPRRLQFSLRTLFAVVTVACAASAFVAWRYREPRPVYDMQLLRCWTINCLDAKAVLCKLISQNRQSLKSQIDVGTDSDNNLLFLSGRKEDLEFIRWMTDRMG